MSTFSKEARLKIAIKDLYRSEFQSVLAAAKAYNLPRTSLVSRMSRVTSRADSRNAAHKLEEAEEEVLVWRVLNLDSRGFSPRIADIEEMANTFRAARQAPPVGKL
jgi:hypothetical protein